MKTRPALLSFIIVGAILLSPDCQASGQYVGHWTPKAIFNVLDYGAKGDGSTDDTAAIQSAIAAAQALTPCGTVIFPPLNYVVNTGPVTVTHQGCHLIGYGGPTHNESSPYFGSTLMTNVASQDILFLDGGATGVSHSGPTVENLAFVAYGNLHTQKLIHIRNFNRGRITRCSFRDGGTGIYMEDPSGDDSDWSIDGNNTFRNLTVGVDIANVSPGGGQNVISNDYFDLINAGDIAVRCLGVVNSGPRIIGNKIDGNGAGSVLTTGVYTSCFGTTIALNEIEGAAPNVWVDQAAGGNTGRGVLILGNRTNNEGPATGTITCTPSNGSPTLGSCTTSPITAGVIAGMELKGTGIPAYGALSFNNFSGGTYVVSTTSSSILMTENATSSPGAVTVSFCYPIYHFPHMPNQPVSINMNTYVAAGGCGWPSNDGQ
jgi:Pectate lyase superfamily protein